MYRCMAITKALSDENRIRALFALKGRELCVCQIIELLELAPSTVSKHMSILAQAHLIKSRKQGRWRYYRLADDDSPKQVREALAWVCSSFSETSRIRQDAARLKEILKFEPEELHGIQNKKLLTQL
jgi:DNA-binding transcriptional ArsR family regulator